MTDGVLVVNLETLLEVLDKQANVGSWAQRRVGQAHLDDLSLGLSRNFDARDLEAHLLPLGAEQVLVSLLLLSNSQELFKRLYPRLNLRTRKLILMLPTLYSRLYLLICDVNNFIGRLHNFIIISFLGWSLYWSL